MTGAPGINAFIGRRARAFREHHGHGLNEFATMLGMSSSQLSRLELGTSEWTASRMAQVADALGIHIAELVEEADAGTMRTAVSPDEMRVLRSYRSGVMVKFIKTAVDMWEARFGKA